MLTSATLPPWTTAPTMAQSMARLVNFWNDQPPGCGRGMRISVSSSPGCRAVSNNPVKNSPAPISRLPDDRAPVPDLGVADLPGGVGEQRQVAAEQAGRGQVGVSAQRAHRDMTAVVADVAEVTEPADVDQGLRHGQAQLHQREQRMPAGQELRAVAALGRQLKSLIQGGGPLIGKGCGDQPSRLSFAVMPTALVMAPMPRPAGLTGPPPGTLRRRRRPRPAPP